MQERRIELAFENKRWLVLVRTGTADESILGACKGKPAKLLFPGGYNAFAGSIHNYTLAISVNGNRGCT